MIFHPQIFAPEDGVKCIHCDQEYNHRVGGILWQGRQDGPGFKETFICSSCASEVVPGILKDFMAMDAFHNTQKRRMQYIIDAGENAKSFIKYAD